MRTIHSRSLALSLSLVVVAWSAGAASATTVTLNPVKDNTILGDLTANSNGAGDGFYVGKTALGGVRRGLLAFNLSTIPTGATINSVTLKLNLSQTIAGAQTVGLNRLNADWGEGASVGAGSGAPALPGDATWLRRVYNTLSWTTAGGDFVAAPSATRSVAGVGSYTWSGAGLNADVQAWKSTPSSNFGWIVIGNEGATATTKKFDSREGLVPPVLTVDFTPPVPGMSGWGLVLLALAMTGAAVGFVGQRRTA